MTRMADEELAKDAGQPGAPDSPEPGTPAAERQPVPLLEPRDGLPPLIVTGDALAAAVTRLGAGQGPVAPVCWSSWAAACCSTFGSALGAALT